MTAQLLGVTYATAMIPGTDAHAVAASVASAFGIGQSAAANFVAPVLTAYDSEARKVGPYVKGGAESARMAARISYSTGVSSGRVIQTLNTVQNLAASGKIGAGMYNPAVHSTSAEITAAAKTAAATVKKAAKKAIGTAKGAVKEVTPDFVQKIAEGTGEGIGGLGDVMKLLPIVAVVGLGIYAYKTVKK